MAPTGKILATPLIWENNSYFKLWEISCLCLNSGARSAPRRNVCVRCLRMGLFMGEDNRRTTGLTSETRRDSSTHNSYHVYAVQRETRLQRKQNEWDVSVPCVPNAYLRSWASVPDGRQAREYIGLQVGPERTCRHHSAILNELTNLKVPASCLKLEIRLHGHRMGTNTRCDTEAICTLVWLAHAFGTWLLCT